MSKIFGIGLPKSGTTSLHRALQALGYRCLDWPHDRQTVRELRSGNYNLSVLRNYDAFTDNPFPPIFPQLDQVCPGSKFILTVREKESWMASCRAAPFNEKPPIPGSARDFYRVLLYGTAAFSEERFSWVYDNHHKMVEDYFSGGREDDLLVMDFARGQGWDELCGFLGVQAPSQPFPHANPRSKLVGPVAKLKRRSSVFAHKLVNRIIW